MLGSGGAGTKTKVDTDTKPNTDTKSNKPNKTNKPDKPDVGSDPIVNKEKPDVLSQDVDLFDIIKGRLLDEGADEEEALKIMANISQEDFDKLKEDITLTRGDYASRNSAGSAYNTA